MSKIEELLSKKILILDGAMGTMLQEYKFSEEDFRGKRFADSSVSVKGNNDLLSLVLFQFPEILYKSNIFQCILTKYMQ